MAEGVQRNRSVDWIGFGCWDCLFGLECSEMKTCIHCQRILPLESFRKSARMRGGRENGCKDCHNARRRQHYAADPTATLSINSRWAKANRDALNAYTRAWRNRLDTNKRTAKRRKEIDTLADSYVRQLLAGGTLRHSDIPQPLVDAHREVLKIKRFLNEQRQ